jgi:N-acetylmuramoyl-L-alanine amidase
MTVEGRMQNMSKLTVILTLVVTLGGPAVQVVSAQSVRTLYARALARERTLRDAGNHPSLAQLRRAIAAYEALVRRYPASAYCDNALWQGANLSLLAYERFGNATDWQRGRRLLAQLKEEYPSSSLRSRIDGVLRQFEAAKLAQSAARSNVVPALVTKDAGTSVVTLTEIRRALLPDGVRVTIEMDGEALYHQELLDNPSRLFFDLRAARASGPLQGATLKYGDGLVKQIRLGQRAPNTTRVVLDVDGMETYSVFTLYNPFRVIVDLKAHAAGAPSTVATAGANPPAPPATPIARELLLDEPAVVTARPDVPPVKREPPAASEPIPTVPSANLNGQFSLARQLGLGVSRVVIDAGHGGHDPGARANGLTEAELVLDVATRLRKLLQKEPAIEVTMTRDSDVFVPLEGRTAIANRESADLFLSIHANASRNSRARGVETYFLNFASNPEAEAVAARENSGSGRTMHSLPEIVRAIALNNKIDESRDFADIVQKSMVRRLGARNGQLRNLGVKQAPFVVLIGAGMPSVLAEISFLTNKQDAQLLKTPAYRQQIAEALCEAVLRYQGALKKMKVVATRE